MENFVGAKFYCSHALADGIQCFQIGKTMAEFSVVLAALSLYHQYIKPIPN